MTARNVRVLVVDDFEPIRNLISSTLLSEMHLPTIAEASNGLEAVQRADELKPELVLLDLSLPGLNGMEAGRRIRGLSPLSKIVFVTQETSVEVMEAALEIGARGYIAKTDIANELLPGVAAVLSGTVFISSQLAHSATAARVVHRSMCVNSHVAGFYRDDASLVQGLGHCIDEALHAGRGVIAVVTESHRVNLLNNLRAQDSDIDTDIREGRLVVMDVNDICATFGIEDQPETTQFMAAVTNLLDSVATRSKARTSRVVICGECPSTLIGEGKLEVAVRMERSWNDISLHFGDLALYCVYLWNESERKDTPYLFESICRAHSAVLGC